MLLSARSPSSGEEQEAGCITLRPDSAIQGHPSPNLASSMLCPLPLLASCSVNPGPRASPTILISRRLARLLRAAFIVLLQRNQTMLSRVPPPFHSPIGSCCPTARGDPPSRVSHAPPLLAARPGAGFLLVPPFRGGAKLAGSPELPRQGSAQLGSVCSSGGGWRLG